MTGSKLDGGPGVSMHATMTRRSTPAHAHMLFTTVQQHRLSFTPVDERLRGGLEGGCEITNACTCGCFDHGARYYGLGTRVC